MPTPTQDFGFNVDLTRCIDNDDYITIRRHGPSCAGRRIRLCRVGCDVSRSWLRGRVRDDLKKTGDKPVSVDGVVRFC